MALLSYYKNRFDYSPTNKNKEAQQRKKANDSEASNSINLCINHEILYLENKLDIDISDSILEGIVIAFVDYKIKTKPIRKKIEHKYDYSY